METSGAARGRSKFRPAVLRLVFASALVLLFASVLVLFYGGGKVTARFSGPLRPRPAAFFFVDNRVTEMDRQLRRARHVIGFDELNSRRPTRTTAAPRLIAVELDDPWVAVVHLQVLDS